MSRLHLLPPEALIKTGDFDHADWNYKPLLGSIQKIRFRLIKRLFGDRRCTRLLEIGYGSGVFLPELAAYTEKLYGVDIHDKNVEVLEKLAESGISAELVSGAAENLVWQDDFFDCIVAVSAVEFVDDLEKVCKEAVRTLKPSGSFLIVTPGKSPLLDLGLKIMTGESAENDFGDRREQILPTLDKYFSIKKELKFPRYGSFAVKLYTALDLQPKKS